jgi:hypothetical protein
MDTKSNIFIKLSKNDEKNNVKPVYPLSVKLVRYVKQHASIPKTIVDDFPYQLIHKMAFIELVLPALSQTSKNYRLEAEVTDAANTIFYSQMPIKLTEVGTMDSDKSSRLKSTTFYLKTDFPPNIFFCFSQPWGLH